MHFDIPPTPFAGLLSAKIKKKPLVVTYHGDWQDNYGGFFRRVGTAVHNRFLVDKLLNAANVIISPSKSFIKNSEYLVRFLDKVVVIPNGIDLAKFSVYYSKNKARELLNLPQESIILLYLGFLSPYKGLDVLIKSFSIIIEKYPQAILIIAGKGELREELERKAREIHLENKILFPGFIAEDLKPLYFGAADIFCLPSSMSTESFGIVNLEAMSFGLPIVASDIGGIPDIVRSGRNGLLARPNNIKSFSSAILSILDNNKLRKRLGENGKKDVIQYSWERIANETEKIYESIL